MKFLCDEGVERHVVELLEGSILLTSYKDFGELVFRRGQVHEGVVLLRLHGLKPLEKAQALLSVVEGHGSELLNAFAVVQPDRLRIRRADSR